MRKLLLMLWLLVSLLFSCEKNYTCSCYNPGGKFKSFEISGSKERANEKCQKYYEDHYGDIPWNETFCEVE